MHYRAYWCSEEHSLQIVCLEHSNPSIENLASETEAQSAVMSHFMNHFGETWSVSFYAAVDVTNEDNGKFGDAQPNRRS